MIIRIIKPGVVYTGNWETVVLDLDKLKIALGEKRLRDLETFILEEVNKK